MLPHQKVDQWHSILPFWNGKKILSLILAAQIPPRSELPGAAQVILRRKINKDTATCLSLNDYVNYALPQLRKRAVLSPPPVSMPCSVGKIAKFDKWPHPKAGNAPI